jgi:serine/threonine protein kinase
MASSDWEKIKELVDSVLNQEPNEREAFLNAANVGDEVRAEVESLIGFDDVSENLLQLSAVEFAHDFVDDAEQLSGQTVGAYRIVSELGHGGMGAVYLAERADGKFEQKVALKLLKRELNTNALRRHFEQEREILATLVHPNIARLLDAGTTDDKIPFIAMEYIDGLPIDEYCNAHGLNLNDRLELFRNVCGAVDFAHRNLVVHRDLKPSNILVTRDGIPKLLDFGISKILSKGYEDSDSATITRMGVMTPSYASPEQLRRESVTTLSDVYSLGVILFELLSGHRPFEDKESDLRAIYGAVLEQEPSPPSSLVETNRPGSVPSLPARRDSEAVTAQLDTNAQRLRRTAANPVALSSQTIRGDLDNIVLKALRKEPERRYASAGNLSEDISRHLQGLTVTARPNTFSYRASKFVARNRVGVIAAGFVILAVIAGVIATVWQARIAQVERVKAEKRFNDVRSLANSFLFEFSPKIERLPGSTPARQLLVVRALEYLNSLSQESGGDAGLQAELAKAYEKVGDVQGGPYNPNIGDTTGALASYERSLAIREDLAAADPTNFTHQAELANVNRLIGQLHSNGAEYAKAAGFIEKAMVLQEQVAARDSANLDARLRLGEIYRQRGLLPFYEGDNKLAIEFYTKSQAVFLALMKDRPDNAKYSEHYAFSFIAIGEAKGWDSDFEGASAELQQGLDMLNALAERSQNDLDFQRSLMLANNKRAENFQDLEQFDKAVQGFETGVAIAENMRKSDPLSILAIRDVAMCYKKLAQALNDAGRSVDSIAKLSQALNLFKEITVLDPANTEAEYDVANTRFSLGNSHLSNINLDAALVAFHTANEEFKVVLANNPANVYAARMSSHNLEAMAKCFLAMADSKERRKNLSLSADHFRQALTGFQNLQSSGNLGEVDVPKLEDIQGQIAKIEVELN